MESQEIKSKRTKQAEFIFDYFLSRSAGTYSTGDYSTISLSGCTTYDDDLDFVAAFQDLFPPRKPDPNHVRSSINLRRILKDLFEDGYLDRHRQSNHDQYHPQDEPNSQFVYRLCQWVLKECKRDGKTPKDIAIMWNGE
ncbi:hypothetical protein P10VF_233 [Rhizobium phage vB_RleM_P10VF]|uniref:Uncharacterized protein n=1 Tax=Rhizobium phage vB_RleM_P10VF TaxID=1527770 RepID=A0A076YQF2_9CAUD|nr:hypothetical protein P10VF_233 [Rhizobium phage vB_RleM_P10VF]AIK68446.1 hypothetical protein P10VF_233 [Rhizobium phage vB_RleM_P10VF]